MPTENRVGGKRKKGEMGLLPPPGISIRRLIVSFVRMQYNAMLTVATKNSNENKLFILEFFMFWHFVIGRI